MNGLLVGWCRTGLSAAALALGLAGAAAAQTMLTLSNPGLPAPPKTVELDAAHLAALPQKVLRTRNEFVDGTTEFRGPLARDVVALIGRGSATRAVMTALNDYSVEIDLAEFSRYEVILALAMNGAPLSRRDKGPIWVIYPMDQYPELQDPSYNNRLIWQLVRIELR
jgi:hypothetical protein